MHVHTQSFMCLFILLCPLSLWLFNGGEALCEIAWITITSLMALQFHTYIQPCSFALATHHPVIFPHPITVLTQHPKHKTMAVSVRRGWGAISEWASGQTNHSNRYFSSLVSDPQIDTATYLLATCSLVVSSISTAHTIPCGVTSINITAVKVLH